MSFQLDLNDFCSSLCSPGRFVKGRSSLGYWKTPLFIRCCGCDLCIDIMAANITPLIPDWKLMALLSTSSYTALKWTLTSLRHKILCLFSDLVTTLLGCIGCASGRIFPCGLRLGHSCFGSLNYQDTVISSSTISRQNSIFMCQFLF